MKILIVDTYNMIHRARHSFIKGEHATIFNFFRSLKYEIVKHDADKVYIIGEGCPHHRFALNEDYKGTRVKIKDESFSRQKREILALCRKLPVTWLKHINYECDDVIAHLCRAKHADEDVTIISTDTDFIQLLDNPNTRLWNPIKKKYIEPWPVDYVMWKALKGDTSDNVPGVPGIGEKRAFKLMSDLDAMREFLNSDPERLNAYNLSYRQIILAEIDEASKGWETEVCNFDESFLFDKFTEYGFKTIIGKAWNGWKLTMERLDNVGTTTITANA